MSILTVFNPELAKYFFTSDLHKSLLTGKLQPCQNDIYLVAFRVPNKKSKHIVYEYYRYPGVFTESLILHLVLKFKSSKSLVFKN